MFSSRWRQRCAELEVQTGRLEQEKLALQQEVLALRELNAQTQQEQQIHNSYSRYQHELHEKLARFEESLQQTRDSVVGQAESLQTEVQQIGRAHV